MSLKQKAEFFATFPIKLRAYIWKEFENYETLGTGFEPVMKKMPMPYKVLVTSFAIPVYLIGFPLLYAITSHVPDFSQKMKNNALKIYRGK
jgi:hypothetical protein